jgi:uncharacterized protein (TIGR03437 family)
VNNNLRFLLSASCLLFGFVLPARSQNFDTSGTAGLSGQYLYRYVAYFNDPTTGAVTAGCSVTGVMTFDGKGLYTASNSQVYDSAGSQGSCSAPTTGTYGVQSNGIAQLDNPIFAATLFGTFSQPVLTASSTEDDFFDLFVAVQAPAGTISNSALSGAYMVGSLEFQNASDSYARQAWFNMTANGSGALAQFTMNGTAANLGTATLTQSVTGATYTLSANGAGSLTIPLQGSATAQSQLLSGTKVLYISADGNYIIGGSTTGLDMIFGFKAPATAISNSAYSGTYFTSGMDADLSSAFFDAFYGTINANGAGAAIWHERFDDVVDVLTYDNVFHLNVNLNSSGSYNDGTFTTLIGDGGQAVMLIGSGSQFSLNIGVKAPSYTPGAGVWINPIGITNAANYTGITNAFAPGELVNIYGNFGVSSQVDQVIPVPTVLGGVQVLVNGTAAPVYLVSANQISALVPYEVAGQSFGTFQVIVNGAKSNPVTVYIDNSAPGIYTLTQNGIGASAILHSNFTVVNSSSPAVPGETVQLFMNGLGTVTPAVADGAAGPSSPLSTVDGISGLFVLLNDGIDAYKRANVTFAGLAPGFPGLYQVNFTIPTTGLRSGNVNVNFQTNEAGVEMSTINLSGFPGTALTNARAHVAHAGVKRSSAASSSNSSAKPKSKSAAKSRRGLPGNFPGQVRGPL